MTLRKSALGVGALGLVLAPLVLGPVATAWATPALADSPTTCEISRLPMPSGASGARVDAADPTGKTLVGSALLDHSAGAVWRDGEATIIDAKGEFTDMNRKGVGVGFFFDNSDRRGWIFDGSRVQPLSGGSPQAINEAGQIVGSRQAPTSNGPPVALPVIWKSSTAQPVDLASLQEGTGTAYDIAEDGTVVGRVGDNAYLWRADGTGGVEEGQMLPRPEGASLVEAVAIRGKWVVGNADGRAVRWNLDTGSFEFVPEIAEATSVNERGWVVGRAADYTGRLFTGDAVLKLPELRPGWMHFAESVSTDGRTIGGKAQARGNPSPFTERPVVWNCR